MHALRTSPRSIATSLATSFATSLALAVVGAAALGAAGCADPSSQPQGELGTLQVPLTSTSGDGTIYRLSSATFDITSPSGLTVIDGNPALPSITVELAPGLASIALRPDWVLTRSTDGGSTFQQVSALLGTSNPLAFRILADTAQTLSFHFLVRNPNGEVTVRFGVDDSPRQLAGGVRFNSASAPGGPPTGALAPYVNARLDFSTYFTLDAAPAHAVEPDGSKSSIYSSSSFATEFYNDSFGYLRDTVGPSLAGGFLEYKVTAKTDGTQEVSGAIYGYSGVGAELVLTPTTMQLPLALDAQGFPADAFFHEVVPFALTVYDNDGSTGAGTLILRNLLPD